MVGFSSALGAQVSALEEALTVVAQEHSVHESVKVAVGELKRAWLPISHRRSERRRVSSCPLSVKMGLTTSCVASPKPLVLHLNCHFRRSREKAFTAVRKSPKGVLDVGEILTASDGETDRPKVEPCSLAFYVSHVTGRVQV